MRIGIDLGGTKIVGVALDGSREIGRVRMATPRDDYAATVEGIATIVSDLETLFRRQASVGIGIPGTLAPDTGLVKNANSVWLIGKPFALDLEARLGRPVRMANDANCLAVSESVDGAAVGAEVVFAVIVGTGTGAGIAVRGQVLTGPNGIAGEWGHNPLPWADDEERPGPPCYCGARGCIETFLSGPGMARDFGDHTARTATPEEIVAAASAGDVAAEATLARYEHRMARALAAIINILDPDVIVLGGGLSNIERLYGNVPKLWSDYVFGATGGSKHVRTRLVRAQHGDSSGVRGAAWLWPSNEVV